MSTLNNSWILAQLLQRLAQSVSPQGAGGGQGVDWSAPTYTPNDNWTTPTYMAGDPSGAGGAGAGSSAQGGDVLRQFLQFLQQALRGGGPQPGAGGQGPGQGAGQGMNPMALAQLMQRLGLGGGTTYPAGGQGFPPVPGGPSGTPSGVVRPWQNPQGGGQPTPTYTPGDTSGVFGSPTPTSGNEAGVFGGAPGQRSPIAPGTPPLGVTYMPGDTSGVFDSAPVGDPLATPTYRPGDNSGVFDF